MISIPGPQSHQAGTLELIECFAELSGKHQNFEEVREFINGADRLPATVSAEEMALKFDAYLARSTQSTAWGVAVNDRWESRQFLSRIEQLAAGWSLDLAPYHLMLEHLGPRASGSLTAAFGFDSPPNPPRLKLYVQEDPWDAGLGTPEELGPLLNEAVPGCLLPAWLSDATSIGVITLELRPNAASSVKAYIGGADPHLAARDAPRDVIRLADQMAEASPLAGGWYYTTIRMGPDGSHRYAMNKIYNLVQVGFRDHGADLQDAWHDAEQLFSSAGQATAFASLRRELQRLPQLRVVPTASALEASGRSVDLYCAAWQLES